MFDSYMLKDIIVYGLVTILFLKFISPIYEYLRQKWYLRKIPGYKDSLPILGVAFELKTNKQISDNFTKHFCCDEGGMTKVWVAHRPYVNVYRSHTVEPIISSSKHIEKGEDYSALIDWLGYGLLTSGGKHWQTRRKLLTPTFHFQMLETYLDVINNHSKKLIEKLNALSDSTDVLSLITRCTLDTIMETAMGVCINAQDGEGEEYCNALLEEASLALYRIGKPWLSSKWGLQLFNLQNAHEKRLNILHNTSLNAIRKRRQYFMSQKKQIIVDGKKKRLSFMDLLLDKSISENLLSENDIREEVDTFMFEGHDTTTSGLGFCLMALGCHPEFQDKIREEQDAIFVESDRMPTMDDLKKMVYLEACFKESIRMYPPVTNVFRLLKEDFIIDGYLIPKGTNVGIVIKELHMDPKVYPEPERYLPERFLAHNCENRNPYAYIPFSAGPRNCIGQKFAMMEAKTILSSIFRKFTVESEDKMEEVEAISEMVLRPVKGTIMIKFSQHQ